MMSVTEDIKAQECGYCGSTRTDAANGAGERLCAGCAAGDQEHGALDISWDGDAPQDAELTPAQCGYCRAEVKFSPSGAWTPDGTDSVSHLGGLHCGESPDRRHNPAPGDDPSLP